jgi:hypothetical protein
MNTPSSIVCCRIYILETEEPLSSGNLAECEYKIRRVTEISKSSTKQKNAIANIKCLGQTEKLQKSFKPKHSRNFTCEILSQHTHFNSDHGLGIPRASKTQRGLDS